MDSKNEKQLLEHDGSCARLKETLAEVDATQGVTVLNGNATCALSC